MFNSAYTGYNPCNCQPISYSQSPCNTTKSLECWQKCSEDLGCIPTDAKCVIYNGEYLNILTTSAGDNLEDILIKINELIGSSGDIDYSGYDTACLSEHGQVNTQSQFVATISNFVCQNRDDYDTFVNTTYANFVTTTNTKINSILNPGTTGCTSFVIPNGSTIQQILQLISDELCEINTFISLSGVTWNQCATVPVTPTNISSAFSEIIRQMCLIKASIPTGTDTYMVKLTSGDTTENFLANKIKGSDCVTVSTVIDGGINKLEIGLDYTPQTFNFDDNFSVTPVTSDDCSQEFNVSLSGTIGTVTSVGLTVPSIFGVTGSPVTTSGTIGLSLSNQAANTVFAGPTTGASNTPTFRSLVTADIANQMITYAKIQNIGAGKLLGNPTGGATSMSEITIGSGLAITGSTLQVINPVPNCTQFNNTWITSSLPTGAVSGGDLIASSNVTAVTAVSFGTSKSTFLPAQSPIQYKFTQLGELIVRGTVRMTFSVTTPGTPSVFTILLGNITPGACFNNYQNTMVLSDHIHIPETQASKDINCYVGLKTDGTLFMEVKISSIGSITPTADVILSLDGTTISVTSN